MDTVVVPFWLPVVVTGAAGVARAASCDKAASGRERWSAQKAWEWYKGRPCLVGFNRIPANSINTTEMCQKETFDPVTIESPPSAPINHGSRAAWLISRAAGTRSAATGVVTRRPAHRSLPGTSAEALSDRSFIRSPTG